MASPVKSEAEYRKLRNSKEQQENVRLARQGDEEAKKRLVQFNYSGHFPDGIVKGIRLPNKPFGVDFDDNAEFERVSKILLADPEKYGLLMLERSARQGGHAVLRRTPGRTILECQVELAMKLQCEMDTNAHDINRVYFSTTASEEDLLYLSPELFVDDYDEEAVKAEAELLWAREHNGLEQLPPGAHKANKHYRPWLDGVESTEEAPKTKTGAGKAKLSAQPDGKADAYEGIPYSEILSQWWKLYNDGKEPTEGNRDTLTFELARDLRHICGFNRDLMNKVIPAYDNFPDEQKLKCIDSALCQPRTQMPYRIKQVVKKLKQIHANKNHVQDPLYWYNQLPKMPMGISDSIDGVGHELAMPALVASCPAVGALATEVQVCVHDEPKNLNLFGFVCGNFSGNKKRIETLIEKGWMKETIEQDTIYWNKENEYRRKMRDARNKKDQPKEENYGVRYLTLENTMANIASRVSNAEGKHCFSYNSEADSVVAKWKNDINEFSVMMRKAYDGSRYDREAKSIDAVSVHIPKLLWNVVMCGTPDALFRLIKNATDGFMSRISLSTTTDNTYEKLEVHPPKLTARNKGHIQQIAHLLPLMKGTIDLPKLEAQGQNWVEEIRIEAEAAQDSAKARLRMRSCVNAQVMMACLLVVKAAEKLIKTHGQEKAEEVLKADPEGWLKLLPRMLTTEFLGLFDVLADYLLEQSLMYFRKSLERGLESNDITISGERLRHGKNDLVLSRLPQVFNQEQLWAIAAEVKGSVKKNTISQMIKNWKKQGLIEKDGEDTFRKV